MELVKRAEEAEEYDVAPPLDVRVRAVAACWEVWTWHLLEARRLAQLSSTCGDFATADQMRTANAQLRAQHCEAYARAMLQCAIAHAADGLDTSGEFSDHFRELWGERIAGEVIEDFDQRFAAAVNEYHARREAAKAQAAAMRAAGV